MNLLELHLLQSFPVSCLNRDDVGAPKSATFGGVQRARVSSQCWKRAIRALAKELQPAFFAATRSRLVVSAFQQAFVAAGQPEPIANQLATIAADATGKLDDKKPDRVKTLLFFSPDEIRNVAQAMLDAGAVAALPAADATKKDQDKAQKALDDIAKKAAKALANSTKDAADIAIFGRMVADDHSLTVDGAGMFSHALSTHRADNEVDFFSAVDDDPSSRNEETGAGAGHIGTLEFNSACYYRCVVLNLDLLRGTYLAHFTDAEYEQVLGTFIRAVVQAVPAARKNSMFAFTPPNYVLGLRRQGQPLSLVNAFELAVRQKGGYVAPSIEALQAHYRSLKATYGLTAVAETAIPAVNLDTFVANLLAGKSDAATAAQLAPATAEAQA
jgi:CRISPR system Cascade subunit CasC